MSLDRVAVVEQNLDAALENAQAAARLLKPDSPLRPGSSLTARRALQLFEDQVASRQTDVVARELKKTARSFYTISSAGHEQNGILGALLRPTDPCFLHYRSGALMMARARQVPGTTPLFDALLGIVASTHEPIAGGRHKVWGSRELWVPPQTSTIASHLPKATGLAFALSRARRIGVATELPHDAIVCCSFGDASINHATAMAGIHSARYAREFGNPTPILFVCEDNGRGISVETPHGWIEDLYGDLKELPFFHAEGEVDEIWDVVEAAVGKCRRSKSPVFLHLKVERLWGHAGSDQELAYRSRAEVEEVEARDPLLRNARRLIELGVAAPVTLQTVVAETRERALAAGEEAARRPVQSSLEEIVAPLAPYDEEAVRAAASWTAPRAEREDLFGRLPEDADSATKRTLAAHLNAALHDEMAHREEILVFGEDVGRKGGVYGITQGLQKKFGRARVFDTLLDETTILGVAQGAGHLGLLPVPEIQYLAYVHNALDQLRGEACSLSFFSNGQFTNPMVVRIAGLAYQRGFGGHFHNDNSIGALRDIPGLLLAAPSRGDDAVRMLRGCIAMAAVNGRVACFLEPIALYHERDLYQPGDGGWLSDYPAPGEALLPGEVGLYGEPGADLCIVSYANGVRLALRAAHALERESGIRSRVVDLRWLNPLPIEAVLAEAEACGRVLVVDECRATGGGIADALIAGLCERGFSGTMRSVRAADTYVPLGPGTAAVLVGEEDVAAAARGVLA